MMIRIYWINNFHVLTFKSRNYVPFFLLGIILKITTKLYHGLLFRMLMNCNKVKTFDLCFEIKFKFKKKKK